VTDGERVKAEELFGFVDEQRIREAMAAKGLDITSLAELIERRREALSRVVSGKAIPRASTLELLATVLDVSMDWLVGR
jgi:transcriptional regulator with XRE-family HTH domain